MCLSTDDLKKNRVINKDVCTNTTNGFIIKFIVKLLGDNILKFTTLANPVTLQGEAEVVMYTTRATIHSKGYLFLAFDRVISNDFCTNTTNRVGIMTVTIHASFFPLCSLLVHQCIL